MTWLTLSNNLSPCHASRERVDKIGAGLGAVHVLVLLLGFTCYLQGDENMLQYFLTICQVLERILMNI